MGLGLLISGIIFYVGEVANFIVCRGPVSELDYEA